MNSDIDLSNIAPEEARALRENYEGPHHIILTDDHASLFLRSWPAESKVAVLILHGVTAHSKPYEVMAEPLAENGFQVFGLDLRGHGLSSGNRGDYKSMQVLHDDLSATLTYIRKNLGYSKIVLLGHSLGVLTSLKILYHNLGEIDGVGLFSAALESREGVRPELGLWNKLKILISSIFRPSKPVIPYFREGMQGLDDPLFNFRYTLRFFKIFDVETISLPLSLDIPLFMGIGDQDELFAVEDAKKLFDQLHADDKQFDVMEGCKHAEFQKNSFDNFIEWMNRFRE